MQAKSGGLVIKSGSCI